MADSEAGTKQMLRLDLVIAIVALAVSSIAALGTWYQTKVVAEQLSSTVWPYLSFGANVTSTGRVSFSLTNDGTGPAVIRGARIEVDGKPYHLLSDFVLAIGFHKPPHGHHRRIDLDQSSVEYGQVLRAGESQTFLSITDADVAAHMIKNPASVTLETCYCSILDKCWIDASSEDPRPVDDCTSFQRQGLDPGKF